jgi:tRNA pseudouridine55 synthase
MPSVNGVLIIDKPAGITSHDVVARTRKIIGERRVGHTGTLDPFATGVLVLLVGRATRIAQFLSGAEKEYEGVVRLGYSTDTGDITGKRVESSGSDILPSKAEVEASIASLRGEIEQLPPMYSAKRIAGRKLYEHARRGEEVAREPVHVSVHEFELLNNDARFLANDDGSLDFSVRVVCSAGTYMRRLAEDLGQKLGVGAHLVQLRRTRAGQFRLDSALTLERLAEVFSQNQAVDPLISPHEALSDLPSIDLDEDQLRRTLHGLDLPLEDNDLQLTNGDPVRLARDDELIAIGKFERERGVIHPAVVLGEEE